MTREEAKSCICTIKMLQKLAYNIHGDADNCKKIIEALEQQSCEDKRLYIKVFADLEPDDIAEKIYQICDEDKFPKVVESLKEYFDFEPCEDCISRQAVLDIINFEDKWLFDAKSYNADTNIAFFTIKKKITEMPSVTPQQPKQEPILDKIREEIKEWYWQADKQTLAKDPCVVDAMIDLFIRTIDKYKASPTEAERSDKE